MKKTTIMLLLVLLGAGLVEMSSCRKDDIKDKELSVNDPGGDQELATEIRIKAFTQKCAFYAANPTLKSSDAILFSDAFWLLEASLNYTFGFSTERVEYTRMDSCMVLLPKINTDSVEYQDVAQVLQQLTDSLQLCFSQVLWTSKQLIVMDLIREETPDQSFFQLKMKWLTGKILDLSIPFSNPYNSNDYWFYGGMAGKCGPCYGLGYGSDAAMEISQYQQWFQPDEFPGQGTHCYYTDIEDVMVFGNQYLNPLDLVLNDNMQDYLMFYSDPSQSNYHDCLNPDEMWFYLEGLYHVVSDTDKACSLTTPPQKQFISLMLLGVGNTNSVIQHEAAITYGIKHVSIDPALPMELPYY